MRKISKEQASREKMIIMKSRQLGFLHVPISSMSSEWFEKMKKDHKGIEEEFPHEKD